MLVNKTFEDMLEDIEFKDWTNYSMTTPKENPNLFFCTRGNHFVISEKYLDYILNSIWENYRTKYTGQMRDVRTILDEATLNAIGHGNKNQTDLPVSIKIFKGNKGYVVRIRDSGKGFDFENTLLKLRKGEKYFKGSGCGFCLFYDSRYCNVSYEGNGSIVNIQISMGDK